MGKKWAALRSAAPKRDALVVGARPFQLASLERRLLMCVEHLQHGHLPDDLGTFGVHLDVPQGAEAATDTTSASSTLAAAPLTAIPALSSRPGAAAKLYLDFNGDTSSVWGEFAPGTTPAYDQDGVFASFSTGELAAIQEIWSRVAEKYSPFNIDVTTVDPGNLNNYQTARVVFGGTGSWLGAQAGGVAYVGGFYNGASNTSWVFTKNLGNGYAQYAAEAAAHESGHLFGLQHQGQWSGTTLVSEYSPGTSTTAPIMGNSYSAPRGLWWRGTPSTSPYAIQDDMTVLGGSLNRFGYRADDFGGTTATASALALTNDAFSTAGVIERTSDWDYFKFNTGAGNVSFDASTIGAGATLDLRLGLFDSAGTQLALVNTSSLGEKLTGTIASAGTYYLGVASRGNYGDVGQYRLTGTVAPTITQPAPNSASFVRTDTTTRGTWKGAYGSEGFNVVGESNVQYPAGTTVGVNGASFYMWRDDPTGDYQFSDALQEPGASTGRTAATWYSGTSFNIDVKFTDNATHQVAMYMVDWADGTRQQKVELIDPTTGTVLDMRSVSNFYAGKWLVWNVRGNVQFRVTRTGGVNAVVSGLFFDPATTTGASSGSTTTTTTGGTTTVAAATDPRTTSRRREIVFSTQAISTSTTISGPSRSRDRAFDFGVRDRVTL